MQRKGAHAIDLGGRRYNTDKRPLPSSSNGSLRRSEVPASGAAAEPSRRGGVADGRREPARHGGTEKPPSEMRAERRGAAPQAMPRRPEPVHGKSEGRRMHMYTQEREDKAASREHPQPGGSSRAQAEGRQTSSMPVQKGRREGSAREVNRRCAEARRLMQAGQGNGEAGKRGRSPLPRASKCRRERKQLQ